MRKCDDCDCTILCARWVEDNRTAAPAEPEDVDRLIKARIASRGGPREADWAEGRNPFARPHPELPWVDRGLTGPVNDFPVTPPAMTGARRYTDHGARRLTSLSGHAETPPEWALYLPIERVEQW